MTNKQKKELVLRTLNSNFKDDPKHFIEMISERLKELVEDGVLTSFTDIQFHVSDCIGEIIEITEEQMEMDGIFDIEEDIDRSKLYNFRQG